MPFLLAKGAQIYYTDFYEKCDYCTGNRRSSGPQRHNLLAPRKWRGYIWRAQI